MRQQAPAPRDPAALAHAASRALLAELAVTPKPGLVDLMHRGAHRDLCADRMSTSAYALEAPFAALARAASTQAPTRALREELGALGRAGECTMLRATGGVNTHRGALYALGLLAAAAASLPASAATHEIAARAGALAALPDRFAPRGASNGALVALRYGARGARGEATAGFPSVLEIALPRMQRGDAAVDVLLALVARVDDTCVLHRAGRDGARFAQAGAADVLRLGGSRTIAGRHALHELDAAFVARGISPGGCADLLAAALLLQALAA